MFEMSILTMGFLSFIATPGPPSTPWVTNVTRESITVGWHEPVSNGGSPVIGYHLEMKDRNSILWQKANKILIRTTHFKVTTISAGLIYEFRVYAENAAGIGKPSHPSEPVLAIDACGMYLSQEGQFRLLSNANLLSAQ